MRGFVWAPFAVGCALVVCGCAGWVGMAAEHQTYKRILAAQRVHPEGVSKDVSLMGLDSQEAAIIAEGYRRSLAREKQGYDEDEEPLLLISPTRQAPPQLPPPSVPPPSPPGTGSGR